MKFFGFLNVFEGQKNSLQQKLKKKLNYSLLLNFLYLSYIPMIPNLQKKFIKNSKKSEKIN
jgi:hypothetical protein